MKLTFNNYFDHAGKIPFVKMPETFSKSHQLVEKATNHGKNWDAVTSNDTLKRVTSLYLEKLSAFLMANPEYLPTEKPAVKASKPKAASKPKVAKTKVTKPKAEPKAAKPKAVKKPKTTTAKPKPAKAVKPKALKTEVVEKPAVVVRKKSLELQIVTRLLNMNGKSVKKESLVSLHRMINKAEAENKFMQGSKAIIEYVNEQIQDVIASLADQQSVKLNLKAETLEKLNKVASGAKVRLRVDYLGGVKAKKKVKKRVVTRKKKARTR